MQTPLNSVSNELHGLSSWTMWAFGFFPDLCFLWVWVLFLACAFSALCATDVVFLSPFFFLQVLFQFIHFHSPPPLLPLWLPIMSSLSRSFILSFSKSFLYLSALSRASYRHLNPFITSHLSFLFVSHSLYFPSCYFLSPSVFCVSRTLTVTQIFWLLAVPWGWDAVSALHLEVLYDLHLTSFNQHHHHQSFTGMDHTDFHCSLSRHDHSVGLSWPKVLCILH